MEVLLILGGVAAVWFLLQNQQKQFTAQLLATKGTAAPAQQIDFSNLFGSGSLPVYQDASKAVTTDAKITQGFQTALAHDPDPTGISQAVLAIGGQISAIFTKHHAEAVQREATISNDSLPRWRYLLTVTLQAYSSGQIAASQAKDYIGQAVGLYYQEVKGIPMQGKPTAPGCDHQYKFDPMTRTVSQTGPCWPPPISPCNGPCAMAWAWVEPEADQAKTVLDFVDTHGGAVQWTLGTMPANASNGYKAVPSQRIIVRNPRG